MASESTLSVENVQIVAYLKRDPALTRAQFYDHWEQKHAPIVKPFFEKHGIVRYQQVQTFGTILPNQQVTDMSVPEGSKQPIEFDGIAMTLVHSFDAMAAALGDPYYAEVVAVDEARFLDREAPGKGIVAVFYGRCVSVI